MFARRLMIYLIGFFWGCLIVYFLFFRGKTRSFFPSGIILDSLQKKEIIIDQRDECALNCYGINKENLKQLLDDADVLFSESSPRAEPRKYMVEITAPEGTAVKINFEMLRPHSKIDTVIAEKKSGCICN